MARTNVTSLKLNKARARQFVADVSCEKTFWNHDGREFKNLQELALGLISMDNETYMYHVNNNKNDFSHWVKEVIGDHEMARELEQAVSRTDAAEKVTARVTYLSSLK